MGPEKTAKTSGELVGRAIEANYTQPSGSSALSRLELNFVFSSSFSQERCGEVACTENSDQPATLSSWPKTPNCATAFLG